MKTWLRLYSSQELLQHGQHNLKVSKWESTNMDTKDKNLPLSNKVWACHTGRSYIWILRNCAKSLGRYIWHWRLWATKTTMRHNVLSEKIQIPNTTIIEMSYFIGQQHDLKVKDKLLPPNIFSFYIYMYFPATLEGFHIFQRGHLHCRRHFFLLANVAVSKCEKA